MNLEIDLRFPGTWALVEQRTLRDGVETFPRGRDAVGVIMYDAAGNMAVQLARASFEGGDLADFRTAIEGYLAYFGTYTVNVDAETVTHHLTACSYPGWAGTAQVRYFAFEGDRLTLTAYDGDDTRIVTWERRS